MTAPASINSNVTGTYIAKESTPKVLPGTPVWRAQEPNSYGDTGEKITVISRTPINDLRKNLKGGTTDRESAAGFNTDITQDNMKYLLEGLFCQEPFEKVDTIPINGSPVAVSSVATTGLYNAASGFAFVANDLVLTSGFTNAANNGFGLVTAVTADTQVDTNISTVTESSPPATAKLQQVGFQFASADVVAASAGGVLTLTSTVKDMTDFALEVGEWIFIGDTSHANYSFPGCTGYARVLSVTATVITCDKFTGTFTDGTASGKTIRIFFGTTYQDVKESTDAVEITYQVERQLGNDGDGIQSQYIRGCYADKLAVKMATAGKMEADLSFVALDTEIVAGATGIKSGTRVAIPNQDLINTSSNVYRMALNLIDNTLAPSSQFAHVSEVNFDIDNGYKPAKAIATIGAFDVISGNFTVKGTLNGYFSTLEAIQAIADNDDVTLDIILAKQNAGFVIDFPLLTLGGGNLQIALNEKIKVPLDMNVVQCDQGHTASWTIFQYLPDIAMPTEA